MRPSNFKEVHRLIKILGVCLCLVLVGIIISGAAACAAPGSLSNIVFTANPMKAKSSDSVLYNYLVTGGATKVELWEKNNILQVVNGPANGTYRGTFKGMNVSYLVGWAFAIAASANLPAILMILFWKKTTA